MAQIIKSKTVPFCDSLAMNTVGDAGSESLANALKVNTSLEYLK